MKTALLISFMFWLLCSVYVEFVKKEYLIGIYCMLWAFLIYLMLSNEINKK